MQRIISRVKTEHLDRPVGEGRGIHINPGEKQQPCQNEFISHRGAMNSTA